MHRRCWASRGRFGAIPRVPETSIGSPDREACSSEFRLDVAEAATGDIPMQMGGWAGKVVHDFRVIPELLDFPHRRRA
jgi:hypothetical protein